MDGAYRPVGRTRNPPSLELASSPQGHISIKRNCGTLRKKKKKKLSAFPGTSIHLLKRRKTVLIPTKGSPMFMPLPFPLVGL